MADKFSSEALIINLKPPENATQAEIDAFRNAVDPDAMGFDGAEVGELSESDD